MYTSRRVRRLAGLLCRCRRTGPNPRASRRAKVSGGLHRGLDRLRPAERENKVLLPLEWKGPHQPDQAVQFPRAMPGRRWLMAQCGHGVAGRGQSIGGSSGEEELMQRKIRQSQTIVPRCGAIFDYKGESLVGCIFRWGPRGEEILRSALANALGVTHFQAAPAMTAMRGHRPRSRYPRAFPHLAVLPAVPADDLLEAGVRTGRQSPSCGSCAARASYP